ncbi:MAG: T9SS type A sorting domain-containing protein [Paludibacter sp.]|jgi:hypothetical protein|nr:T9SS type A sorting domain-containing protein [Paludibacter sp.]
MKQKIYILVVALVAMTVSLQAQASSFLRVTYATESGTNADNFSIEGGEIQILDNTVNIVFSGNPEQNRTYLFDDIRSLQFEIQTSTGNLELDVPLVVYTDKAGVLHLRAMESLGLINVYSIAGTLVASVKSDTTEACIDFKEARPGMYIVKTGNQTVKFIK